MAVKKLFFTAKEVAAIQYAERVSSVLSVLGCFFVIATFCSMRIFRKPINRLVFYATFGNLATNVATLISRSGILAGENSSLCQFQAFIIQMCMPADALWMFSMALNVFLTFFYQYGEPEFTALEKYYFTFNYGIPAIPAVVFMLVRNEERGHIFGNATLWCWVTVKWNALRIATFYGPVWVVLLTTMAIYIIVGRIVFQNQARFRELTAQASRNQASMAASIVASPSVLEQGHISVITEVDVTSEPCANSLERVECMEGLSTAKVKAQKEKKEVSSADRAAWAYLKCALLFFTAMLVTWVPATSNRIATLINPTLVSFELNFVEALLLPLQGFFNAVIYITISTDACNYLRAHCRRVFRQIFINPWKHALGLPITIPMNNIAPVIPGAPTPRSRSGKNKPSSYGPPEMDPQRPRKAVVKPIQPEEMEEYQRLHKVLRISPEPGFTAGSSNTGDAEEYERLYNALRISQEPGSTAISSNN
ncbi:hypothetical protein VC83_03654 [Pseudogymnoascus destructans]|uniref:G-protein coupled receptors family 2 profile 2 domain-containing protein n=2 Tax=Pseudogymnoascus destructans TaxID=655981 RepID=L8FWI1_PSED2|nr:uncharacterized protein VC83_03654 [Pseudogymnoascus destructans]ELR04843.1 hypothetical protein GMDG_07068 [Pseudogymnoascus destructans 20631-21]OAF60714.1 hypothetical protein VC83_03654 [Pseudogymnoascus destructans]